MFIEQAERRAMEEASGLLQDLLSNKEAFVLLLTAGSGLLLGRLLRMVSKVVAYLVGSIVLLLAGLEYLGIIYIVVNFEFLHEIFNWVYVQAGSLGVSEHLFFWVPLVQGFRKRAVLRLP